jgi:uncharacterized BrkB/YihY/UPF0761 family membrane protein
MKTHTRKLIAMIGTRVIPAYLAPCVMVSIAARLIPDRVAGRALARAALTTIAIPSALASLAVTVFLWRRLVRHNKPGLPVVRSGVVAAMICGALSAAISAELVANNYVASRLFLDAVPSSVIGGTVAAVQITTRKSSLPEPSET